jgi:hypothetical protein
MAQLNLQAVAISLQRRQKKKAEVDQSLAQGR